MTSRFARLFIRVLLVLVAVYVLIEFLILPIGFAVFTAAASGGQVGLPPEGFIEVTLTTSDQETLAAWYRPPANGAVILLIAGAGGTREDTRAYADVLVSGGFGVLAFDLRGHGESSGTTNKRGWQGTRDVGAAVEYLSQQDEVVAVGGLGLSLGGEVLLGAASTYPALRAIVSDGATARSLAEHDFLPSVRSLPVTIQMGFMDFVVQLLMGDQPPLPLGESLAAATSTQFLFIAAGNEADEVAYNTAFAELVGERGTVWIVPEVGHTAAFSRYPQDYTQRVMTFFTQVLLSQVSMSRTG